MESGAEPLSRLRQREMIDKRLELALNCINAATDKTSILWMSGITPEQWIEFATIAKSIRKDRFTLSGGVEQAIAIIQGHVVGKCEFCSDSEFIDQINAGL